MAEKVYLANTHIFTSNSGNRDIIITTNPDKNLIIDGSIISSANLVVNSISTGSLFSTNSILTNTTIANLFATNQTISNQVISNISSLNLIVSNISAATLHLQDPSSNTYIDFTSENIEMGLDFGSTNTNQSLFTMDTTGIIMLGPFEYTNSGTPGYANFNSDINMGSHKLSSGSIVSTNLNSTNISGSNLSLTSSNGTYTAIDNDGFYFATPTLNNYLQIADLGGTTISGQLTVLGTTGTVLATPTNMLGRPISTGNINSGLITSSSTINSVALSSGNIYTTNLIATNTTFTNLGLTSISVGSIYAPVATITNIATTNLSAGNISVSGSGILTAGFITVGNLLAPTISTTNLKIASISTGSVYTPVSTITNLVATNTTFSNLGVSSISTGSVYAPVSTITNIVGTNISAGILTASTLNTTAVSTANLYTSTIFSWGGRAIGHGTGASGQNIANGTNTLLTTYWNGTFTTGGGISYTSGNFTVPRTNNYIVTANISFGTATLSSRTVFISKNSNLDPTVVGSTFGYTNVFPVGTDRTGINVSAVVSLAANDTIGIIVYQATGGGLPMDTAVPGYFSIAEM